MLAQMKRAQHGSRFRYGDTILWVPRENLGGSRAQFVLEQVELHFRDRGTPLIVDLRHTGFIDSEGAAALEFARRRHSGFIIVGRPRDFDNLPPSIRSALAALRPASDVESALSSLRRDPLAGSRWETKRRYCRIPVEIPVEIVNGEMAAAGMLEDLSLGGGRLTSLSAGVVRKLGEGLGRNGSITITGVTSDPLGNEIAARYASTALPSRAVHVLPGFKGLGIQFSGNPASPA
jgi:hypothetical protein